MPSSLASQKILREPTATFIPKNRGPHSLRSDLPNVRLPLVLGLPRVLVPRVLGGEADKIDTRISFHKCACEGTSAV